MGGEPNEEDDADYCTPADARLRWMEENGEDLSLLLIEKRNHDDDVKLIDYLNAGPRFALDIQEHFNWTLDKVRRHLMRLRKQKVDIHGKRIKSDQPLQYVLLAKPIRLPFHYRGSALSK